MLLAVGILTRDRLIVARAAVFTLGAAVTVPLWAYLWPATQDSLRLLGFHWIVVPLTFLPPLAIALVGVLRSARGTAEEARADAPSRPYAWTS